MTHLIRWTGAAAVVAVAAMNACGGDADVSPDGKLEPTAGAGGSGPGAGGSSAGGSTATGGRGIIVGMSGEAGQTNGGGQGGEGANCGSTALSAQRPIVNMLLVVDKSSSMDKTDEFSEGRWATLGTALGVALEEARDRVAFGLEFFPFADDPEDTPATCETPGDLDVLVPIGPGSDTVPVIVDALADYDPAGGTPTADALAHALDYFENGDGKDLKGDRYVLLATDGGPNCNDDIECDADSCTINLENETATTACGGNCCDTSVDPASAINCVDEDRTVARVTALADAGIKTFVVGIPGSQFFADTLDKLAEAGGQPNPDAPPSYYRVTDADGAEGLADVLTRITTGLITSCRLELTSTPADPNYEKLLNVEIDGENVPQMGEDGWSVDRDTSPPTIVLAGATCDYMEEHGAEQVRITYGCPTVMVK
jgi:hypothetical protein